MAETHYELRSPTTNQFLTELEGKPEKIEAAGNHYTAVGTQLHNTAVELKKLADDDKYKADALDAIRGDADDLQKNLEKVSKRYSGAGPVLVTYATALRKAQQTTVDPYVPEIVAAHKAHEEAVEARQKAESDRDDLDDPTDADKTTADTKVTTAQGEESTAETNLTNLWESFDSGYSEWSKAYEDAIDGIGSAIKASDINDSWWEDLLDSIATIATIIGTIAIIIAIVATGPFAAAFLLVATIASVVALAAHVTMMACGSKRVSWGDIALDALGVVPFVGSFGKALKGGEGFMGALRGASGLGGASRATLTAGRNAMARDLRTIAGAGGDFGGQAGRAARAPGIADNFLAGVEGSWGRNAWNALRTGGTRMDGTALTMSERMASSWPGGTARLRSTRWMANLDGPGGLLQTINVTNAAAGAYQTLQGLGIPLPDIPGT